VAGQRFERRRAPSGELRRSEANCCGGQRHHGGIRHGAPTEQDGCGRRRRCDRNAQPAGRLGAQREVAEDAASHEDRQPKQQTVPFGRRPRVQAGERSRLHKAHDCNHLLHAREVSGSSLYSR
jgi:hypothetical protein